MTRSVELALVVTLLAILALVFGLLVGPRLSAGVPSHLVKQTTEVGR